MSEKIETNTKSENTKNLQGLQGLDQIWKKPIYRKIGTLIFLLLISSLPKWAVQSLIYERQGLQAQAASSITEGWANRQELGQIYLDIDYYFTRFNPEKKLNESIYQKFTLDSKLTSVKVTDSIQIRHRGIYKVPIYDGQATIDALFTFPSSFHGQNLENIRITSVHLKIPVTSQSSVLQFNLKLNDKVLAFSRQDKFLVSDELLGQVLTDNKLVPNAPLKFQSILTVKGYSGINFKSTATEFEVSLDSKWPHPSFRGQLPNNYQQSNQGFSAQWKIFNMSTDRVLNVDYFEPVQIYSMTERATKYSWFVTLLVLTVLFLFEIRTRINLHPIQYLFTVLPLSLFYLLLLAISEHLNFGVSYIIGATSVIGLMTAYLSGVGLNQKSTYSFSGTLSLVYLLIFCILRSEDYALLVGAVSIFCALSVVMMLTRKLNWDRGLEMKEIEIYGK